MHLKSFMLSVVIWSVGFSLYHTLHTELRRALWAKAKSNTAIERSKKANVFPTSHSFCTGKTEVELFGNAVHQFA